MSIRKWFFLMKASLISATQTTKVVTFAEWFLVLDAQTTRGVVAFSKWQSLLFIQKLKLLYRSIGQRARRHLGPDSILHRDLEHFFLRLLSLLVHIGSSSQLELIDPSCSGDGKGRSGMLVVQLLPDDLQGRGSRTLIVA